MKKLRFKWFLWRQGLWRKYKKEFYEAPYRSKNEDLNHFFRNTTPSLWILEAVQKYSETEWVIVNYQWNNIKNIKVKNVILRILVFLVVSILGGAVLASLFIVLRPVILGG